MKVIVEYIQQLLIPLFLVYNQMVLLLKQEEMIVLYTKQETLYYSFVDIMHEV